MLKIYEFNKNFNLLNYSELFKYFENYAKSE